ncbi:hypothetical protein BASA81_000266 [Batrachochytrium salamandrivorans]|nr:hypothetical protein BASA81_000266 [Batrachochytrium salamandrivorans]
MATIPEGDLVFQCDICFAIPIVGVRFRCKTCRNFDMCQACKVAGKHNPKHNLIEFIVPLGGEATAASPQPAQPGAEDAPPAAAAAAQAPALPAKKRSRTSNKPAAASAKDEAGSAASVKDEAGAAPQPSSTAAAAEAHMLWANEVNSAVVTIMERKKKKSEQDDAGPEVLTANETAELRQEIKVLETMLEEANARLSAMVDLLETKVINPVTRNMVKVQKS